nr:AI-2E family transporter [Deinococcota bacterium]
VLGGLVSLLTVLVLTFYIILAEKALKQTFLSIIPPQHQTSISDTLGEAGSKMGGWLRGQLILAGITAVVISAGMWLLGMPYPLLLGLIGGIGNLIPLLGSFLAGLVAVPIALLTKPVWVLIAVIVFFVVLGQVEGNWLAPRIMASQVELSPLSSILALLVGIALLGVVGALLAVPLAAGLRIILIRLVVPAIQRANRDHAG